MGAHINEQGEFQSDKYPTCPAGKVPLSVKDPMAQDLLWKYAQRRREVDAEFSDDLERCLVEAGHDGKNSLVAFDKSKDFVLVARVDGGGREVHPPKLKNDELIGENPTKFALLLLALDNDEAMDWLFAKFFGVGT